MKICRRGLEYLQVINAEGDVTACSWTGDAKTGTLSALKVGNLLEGNIEQIYQGEVMGKFLDSLLNQTYEYCPVQCCPYLANGTIEENMVEYEGVPQYPKELSISYERDCNYVCTCCRNEPYRKSCNELDNIKKIQDEIDKVISKVEIISANGYGELFASKNIMEVLSKFDSERESKDIVVFLETNGGLFDKAHWSKIENLGKYNLKVAITIHSFEENTYQYLSGTTRSVEKIITNLKFVKELREQGIINYLELASVVQERNFREMPVFTKRCIEEFGADCVRLRSYFPPGVQPAHFEWFFDPRNPAHPYFEEYCKVMKDPIFKHEKVLMWSGDELSTQKEFPFVTEINKVINYDNLKPFITCDSIPEKIECFCNEKLINEVIVYGAGILGEALVKELQKTAVRIDCILDIYDKRSELRGVKIRNPLVNGDENSKMIIVTAPSGLDEIKARLIENKFNGDIMHVMDIIGNN